MQLADRISQVSTDSFEELALAVFKYQALHNPLYANYLELINCEFATIAHWQEIPCLPISLFKKYQIQTGQWMPQRTFTSSGTTGEQTSRHLLRSQAWYSANARRAFEAQYGSLKKWTILALLPAYLERSAEEDTREGSSLVWMVHDFMKASGDEDNGFFLYDYVALRSAYERAIERGRQVLLLGVSFALLDLAEQQPNDYSKAVVMETGGMKGRRKEITRQELHALLQKGLNVPAIHSEYGMTELLSQAYSHGQGVFVPAPTMRVFTRDINDPFQVVPPHKTGVLNIVDLANVDTISFLATEDLGILRENTTFEVIGRLDAGDIRGCNLLYELN